jgi:transcriptional regulator of aromatic amino acid metabolism
MQSAILQAKLLRVLQERVFERLGGTMLIKADVRVIAATNRNLAIEVTEKCFREDLYYRLNVFPITLPPLRERRDAIAMMVRYFCARFSAASGKRRAIGISGEALRLLEQHTAGHLKTATYLFRHQNIPQNTDLHPSRSFLTQQFPGSYVQNLHDVVQILQNISVSRKSTFC